MTTAPAIWTDRGWPVSPYETGVPFETWRDQNLRPQFETQLFMAAKGFDRREWEYKHPLKQTQRPAEAK